MPATPQLRGLARFRRKDSNLDKRIQKPHDAGISSEEMRAPRAIVPRVYQAPRLYQLPPAIGRAAWESADEGSVRRVCPVRVLE
jgi:hypothetical protein